MEQLHILHLEWVQRSLMECIVRCRVHFLDLTVLKVQLNP